MTDHRVALVVLLAVTSLGAASSPAADQASPGPAPVVSSPSPATPAGSPQVAASPSQKELSPDAKRVLGASDLALLEKQMVECMRQDLLAEAQLDQSLAEKNKKKAAKLKAEYYEVTLAKRDICLRGMGLAFTGVGESVSVTDEVALNEAWVAWRAAMAKKAKDLPIEAGGKP